MRAFDTNALQIEPDLVGQPRRLPAGEAPALQIIFETSLRAFFERGGFTTQVRENFAGEMQ